MMKRKTRTDRNHAIYVITNVSTNEQYIGVTVCSGSLKKALKVRIQKHVRRALTENKDWALCRSIRQYGSDALAMLLVDVVRGRKAAHKVERELINGNDPELNSH